MLCNDVWLNQRSKQLIHNYFVFNWIPVTVVVLIHVWNFANNIRTEGMDGNHMSMDRVSGQQSLIKVNAAYHARRQGARVLLLSKGLVGRGGATASSGGRTT